MPRKRTTRIKAASKPVVTDMDKHSKEERWVQRGLLLEQREIFLKDFDIQADHYRKELEKEKRTAICRVHTAFQERIATLHRAVEDMTMKEFAKAGGTFQKAIEYKLLSKPINDEQLKSHASVSVSKEQWSVEETSSTKNRRHKELLLMKMKSKNLASSVPCESILEEENDDPGFKVPNAVQTKGLARQTPAVDTKGRGGKRAVPATSTRKSTRSRFATPANNCGRGSFFPTPLITPKFDPNLPTTPENIRRMKPGERLISLAGSPVNVDRRTAVLSETRQKDLASNLETITGGDLSPNRLQKMFELISSFVTDTE